MTELLTAIARRLQGSAGAGAAPDQGRPGVMDDEPDGTTTDDPLARLRAVLTMGLVAVADLVAALEAAPASMEAALNRFGRPTRTAAAFRAHARRHAAALRVAPRHLGGDPRGVA
jgi:hypothetical protein